MIKALNGERPDLLRPFVTSAFVDPYVVAARTRVHPRGALRATKTIVKMRKLGHRPTMCCDRAAENASATAQLRTLNP